MRVSDWSSDLCSSVLILRLNEQLELDRISDDDVINIVVLRADDRSFGLVVDGVKDSSEIVVKPLGNHLKGLSTFAGATILGDGSVALILDVMGLAQRAHVINESRDRSMLAANAEHDRSEERRVGKESVSTGRSRWAPEP